ncbi:hypothetical protein JCM8547_001632 [Rhodosporidiobolus lusitaniae]
MPGKHQLIDQGSDGETSPASSKRQRTRTQSSLPRSTPPAQDGNYEGNNSQEDEDEDMDDEEDDERDRHAAEEIRRTQHTGRATKIAEAGVIQQVDLQWFMCHTRTTVDFGPQVNFLVGVNGSGKSAILTGITMALGGNAKATNRGQKGGDLIMEGKQSCRCTVTLANRGEDAYMPHIYGKSITIEREIKKAGGGGYKIKNHEGKTVDTKKATLDAILDSFNIQVDNPMTVLTQDQSRQFLASASPKDKYTFFLRGTQLAQLTEEYETIRSNTEQMEEHLARKREVLPELKEAYRRAKERAKEAKAAIEQQGNLQTLKDQLAWAYVAQIERQVEFGAGEIQKEEDKLKQIDEDIEVHKAAIAEAENQVETLKEAERESKNTVDDRQPRLEEITQLLRAERDRIQRYRDQERKLTGAIARMQETVADYEYRIAEEERKLSRDLEAERRPYREKIDQCNAEQEQLADVITTSKQTVESTSEDYRKAVDLHEETKAQIQNARLQHDQANARLMNVQQSQAQPMRAFGPRMPELLQAIQRETRWRERPIGPIGTLVKLQQSQYADCLERFFGPTLNGFIVTNADDLALFNRVKKQVKLDRDKNSPVIRWELDNTFDVSSGEPDSSILTVLRALKIESPLVFQVLVNAHNIERAALVPLRQDGDTLMRSNPKNVNVAHSADCYALRIKCNSQGRSSAQTMAPWKGPPRFITDVASQVQRLREELERISYDANDLERKKHEAGQQAKYLADKRSEAERTIADAQRRIRALNTVINECTAKLSEEQPNNIVALQEAKRESEAELESSQRQFRAGKEKFDQEQGNNEQIAEEKKEIEGRIRKAGKIQQQITEMMAKQYKIVTDAQTQIKQQEKRKDRVKEQIHSYETEVGNAKQMLEERLEMASSICERPAATGKYRDPVKLQKEVTALEKALKEREKRQGATVEQIMEEHEVRKKVAADAVRQTNEIAKLVQEKILKSFDRLGQALSAAYQTRIERWTDFRSHISQRAKVQFLAHLSNRGFTGKLRFDHSACTLNILIQTEDGKNKQKSKQKDTKSLSGGEKSFSTICLLLTMWEAVGCPLRCLDEFDVFMDAVNRRIAMKMMIETAKTANQTQFILITPQEMSSISWGSEVKVNKLGDPKRSQGALAEGK